MGEMADYYIERQLNRHMNPEKELYRRKRQHQSLMERLTDKELIAAAEKAITDKKCNEKFIDVSRKILSKYQDNLTEKQRNCLYGLLANHI